jgi:hypothetical protein
VELAVQLEDDFGTGSSADVYEQEEAGCSAARFGYSLVCFDKGRGGVLATFRGHLAAIKFEIS